MASRRHASGPWLPPLLAVALAGLAPAPGHAQAPDPTPAPPSSPAARPAAPPAPARPTILVLASYHRGFLWTDQETDGALEALRRRWPGLDPLVEHLDATRASAPEEQAARFRELKRRYAGLRFDGVLATDDDALAVALAHRADLFAGAAIAFAGVNTFDPARVVDVPRLAGVLEEVDVVGTFGLVRALQPDVRTILVVLDRTETSAGIEGRVRLAAQALGQSVGVRVEADRTLEELEGLVAGLDRRTAVVLGSFTVDRRRTFHGYGEVAERLCARSGAPVYGLWDFQLDHGIVGGSLLGGLAQGRRAGELLVALLDGGAPVVDHGVAIPTVDLQVAGRLGLDPEDRLAGRPIELLHRAEPIWERHRTLVNGVVVALVALLAFALVLLEILRRMRRTEQRLRESEARQRATFDSVDDAIFIHDPATGAVLDCNRRACEMYQLPRETILREGIGHLSAGAPPYALADARRWLQRALESGPQRFEWQARRADGTLFWVEVSLRATAIGGQARVSATTRDLTGVREAARALQRSERRFRELADLLPQVIFEADTGGRLTFVNRRAFQLFGYDPVDLARGVDLRQFVVPHQRELVSENVARAMAGGPSAGNEYQALRRDGTTFPALIYSSPALVDGRPVGLRGLIIDVSDRKRTEEERAAMQRRIEEGQRLESIGRLAGGVAHDFNNLLTPILGHAQQVLDRLGPDHPEAEAVRALVATAEQAGQLTRQLLAFSKRQVLQDRELDLNEEVGALHAMLRRVIGEDVVVRLDLAANLGAIRGDSGQLQQVLIDLVANARDAMPGGGVLTIATRGVPAAEAPPTLGGAVRDLVELSVTDTGVGLTEEVRARVFEPFFTARGPGRGAGLGLGTALGVVQQHGGDIEVRSAPGRGTTFRLLFPRAAPARPARVSELALTPAPAPLAPPPALDVRGRTVLVAEDEPAVRRLVEGYLRSAGFEVLSAATGREALDLAARHGGAIDLLLTDVVMPGMNGRELQRALAQRHPGVKVVYMSGYPALPGGPGALEDLVDELLEKPFTRGALLEKLSGALRAAPAAGRV